MKNPIARSLADIEAAAHVSELLNEVADVLISNNWRGDLIERLRDLASSPAAAVSQAPTDKPNFCLLIDALLMSWLRKAGNSPELAELRIKARADLEAAIEAMQSVAPADAGIRSAARAEPMPDADIRQLMKFYSAIDLTELARIQARHVERLQEKLPKDNQPAVTFPRG